MTTTILSLPAEIFLYQFSKFLTSEIHENILGTEDFKPVNFIAENCDWRNFMSTNKTFFRDLNRRSRFISFGVLCSFNFLTDEIFAQRVLQMVENPEKQINLLLESTSALFNHSMISNVCSIKVRFQYWAVSSNHQNYNPVKNAAKLSINYLCLANSSPKIFPTGCNLKSLRLDVDGLVNLSCFEGLIRIILCASAAKITLHGYEHLNTLKFVEINNCENIEDLRCWENVQSFKLSNCFNLKFISLQKLTSLNIEYCPFLEETFEDRIVHEQLEKISNFALSLPITEPLSLLTNLVTLKICLPYSSPSQLTCDDRISDFFGKKFPALPLLEQISLENFYYLSNSFSFYNVPHLLHVTFINCYGEMNLMDLVNLTYLNIQMKDSVTVSLRGMQNLIQLRTFIICSHLMTDSLLQDYLNSFQMNSSRSVALSILNDAIFILDDGPFMEFPLTIESKDSYQFLQLLVLKGIGNIPEIVIPTSVIKFHCSLLWDTNKIVFPSSDRNDRSMRLCYINQCDSLQLIQVKRKVLHMKITKGYEKYMEIADYPEIACGSEEGGMIVNLEKVMYETLNLAHSLFSTSAKLPQKDSFYRPLA